MGSEKFIVLGEDRIALAMVKNTLAGSGYLYIGYISEAHHALRAIRKCLPSLVIVDPGERFYDFKPVLDVLDEELLAACILIMKHKNDDVLQYIQNTRVIHYLTKPLCEAAITSAAELSLLNYRRTVDYEHKLLHLNELLESRKLIDQAKWVLVEKGGMTESEAYESIRKRSRDKRLPMRDIAEAILLAQG